MNSHLLESLLFSLLNVAHRRWEHSSAKGKFHNVSGELGSKGIQIVGQWDQKRLRKNFWRVVDTPHEIDFGKGSKYLLPLPPIEKETQLVPYLYLKAWKQSPIWCWRLYVLFFTTKHTGFQGFAIRFESPEKCFQEQGEQGGDGSHDFFHAQLCQQVDDIPLKAPAWLPVTQPSFFLKAQNGLDLLFNMLVSIYSWGEGEKLLKDVKNGLRRDVWNFLENRIDRSLLPSRWGQE